MSDSPHSQLAMAKEKVRRLLARGATVSDAAAVCGLHRSTVYRWVQMDERLRMALHQGQAEYTLTLRDDLRELSEIALRTLMGILTDPLASPSVRMKAATFILKRSDDPKDQWTLPVPMLNPRENFELTEDNPLIAEDEARLSQAGAGSPQAATRQGSTEFDTIRQDSLFAQPAPPLFRPPKKRPAGEDGAKLDASGLEPPEEKPRNAA